MAEKNRGKDQSSSRHKERHSTKYVDSKRKRTSDFESDRKRRSRSIKDKSDEEQDSSVENTKVVSKRTKEIHQRHSSEKNKHRGTITSRHASSRHHHDKDDRQKEKRSRSSSYRRREDKHRSTDRGESDESEKRGGRRRSEEVHLSARHQDDRRRLESRHRRSRDAARTSSTKKRSTNKEIQSLVPLGTIVGVLPQTLLDPDADYFAYHQHLRLFLYRRDGTYFEDLSSEEARQEFQRFVNEFNAGNLEQEYYTSTPTPLLTEAFDQCKRTKHEWKFNATAKELESLHVVKEGVRKQTEYKVDGDRHMDDGPQNKQTRSIGNEVPHKTRDEIAAERRANRRLREHVFAAEEELAGGKKDYGRERQLEKKKEKSAAQHGAALDKEGVELDDRDIYGGGDTLSFKAALARERQHKTKKEEDKAARILALQEKETQKQTDLLKSLGLVGIQPGQRITIAPRTDLED